MKKIWQIFISVFILTALSLTFIGCGGNQQKLSFDEKIKKIRNANVGSYVILGEYEQDQNSDNGTEQIEWIVVKKDQSKALLLSRYILEYKKHDRNDTYQGQVFTWSDSLIRKWLNNDFYVSAFNKEERNIIAQTTLNNTNGKSTTDQIFLLSLSEIELYLSSKNDRVAKATRYAAFLGADSNWWTRSNPTTGTTIAKTLRYIIVNGYGETINTLVGTDNLGVRPAMWIEF